MKNTTDIKKWNYEVIFDQTPTIFKTFNEIYEKDREAAKYYMSEQLYSQRLIAFYKQNIYIIIKEQIYYNVSITLKRYKSTKTLEKYYLDTKNGSISKSYKGKFIPCKPSEITDDIKKYIISKIKWIDFVFKLNLPITFRTIVTKKLYSQRKLLTYYWGTDYKTALKLNEYIKNDLLNYIRNNKNINFNKINPDFFNKEKYKNLFFKTLILSKKCNKKLNLAWSYKRLKSENHKLNRYILDKLYEYNNYKIEIPQDFLPVINYLEKNNFIIPKTSKELSQLSNDEQLVRNYLKYIKEKNSLILKKNNNLLILRYQNDFRDFFNKKFIVLTLNKDPDNEIIEDIIQLNKQYDNLLKSYERKTKIKIISENSTELIDYFQTIE